ncbi:MAG: copper amine oxidase N-terminal domain-containing protein [Lachnospirales bacterium]
MKKLYVLMFIIVTIFSSNCFVLASTTRLVANETDIKTLEEQLNNEYRTVVGWGYDYRNTSDNELVRNIAISLFEKEKITMQEEIDPLNKLNWFSKIDGEYVDWLAKNIFNRELSHSYNSDDGYYYNGNYYYMIEGLGGVGEENTVVDYKRQPDGKYNIKGIETYPDGEQYNFYIIADLKLLGDERTWSFYNVSEEPLFYDGEEIDKVTLCIDNNKIKFPINGVQPIIYNNRVYVPVRKACEYLCINVDYDVQDGRMYFIADGYVSSHVKGTSVVYVNGLPKYFDTTSININGSTLMPIRMLAESIGKSVSWNAITKTVNIETS